MDSEHGSREVQLKAGLNTPPEFTPEAVGFVKNGLIAPLPRGQGLFGLDTMLVELQAGARYRFGPGNIVLVESIVVKREAKVLRAYICQRGWRNGWEPEQGDV